MFVCFCSFPVKRDDVMKKWIEAIDRGENWKPGKASRVCSVHFAAACFKDTSGPRRLLHADAVPTIYKGASATQPPRLSNKSSSSPLDKAQSIRFRNVQKFKDLRRKNKILKLRIRRRDARIKELKSRLAHLKSSYDYEMKVRKACERLEGFSKELLEHSMRNSDTKRTGIRYSSLLREFSLTLYLHSPRAYLYVRSILHPLPNPSLIKKWISNFNRPPPEPDISNIVTADQIVTEEAGITTTEELIIDDIDSFIVIEDPVNIQSCITGVSSDGTTTIDNIPVVVAQHVQIQ